jgi:glutathione S-transferase
MIAEVESATASGRASNTSPAAAGSVAFYLQESFMRLFYAPGACSLSPHIVAQEAGIDLEFEKVDLKTKKTTRGADYLEINPKGAVPALQLDNGEILTEGPVIVQYLADQRPQAGLAAAQGTFARYRLLEMLGFINSEIHKGYSPLFNPAISAAERTETTTYLQKRYRFIESQLQKHIYLLGDQYSVADAYLFTVTNWADSLSVDLSSFPQVLAFQKRIAARPAVQAVMKAEGLIP